MQRRRFSTPLPLCNMCNNISLNDADVNGVALVVVVWFSASFSLWTHILNASFSNPTTTPPNSHHSTSYHCGLSLVCKCDLDYNIQKLDEAGLTVCGFY